MIKKPKQRTSISHSSCAKNWRVCTLVLMGIRMARDIFLKTHTKSTPDTCGQEVARGMLAIRIGYPTSSQPHRNPSIKDNPAFTSYWPQAVRSREKVLFSMLNSKRQHMDGCMIQTSLSSFGDFPTTGVHKVRPHLMQSGSAGLHLGLITHTSTASCCTTLPAGAILSAWLGV